ncbi:MAG: sigma-70 family RNA polymerase sigma factor [Blastocatellia bacterium]|nr:sigma-70 family RNA polymerase sigma factor [Blastocatellia bacterium]
MEKSAAMDEMNSERCLIEACQKGDRDAFRKLFETYKDRVWSIALHFSRDESSALDITQQVFLKLFTSISQFRHDAAFETWLFRMVANACLDERRSRRRYISFEIAGSACDDGQEESVPLAEVAWKMEEEERHMRREISAVVKAAVRELRPKLRLAILLKHFEGLSYEEMAHVLGCSPGTVASRLNRGHKELARRLAHLRSVLEK